MEIGVVVRFDVKEALEEQWEEKKSTFKKCCCVFY